MLNPLGTYAICGFLDRFCTLSVFFGMVAFPTFPCISCPILSLFLPAAKSFVTLFSWDFKVQPTKVESSSLKSFNFSLTLLVNLSSNLYGTLGISLINVFVLYVSIDCSVVAPVIVSTIDSERTLSAGKIGMFTVISLSSLLPLTLSVEWALFEWSTKLIALPQTAYTVWFSSIGDSSS